MSDRKMIDDLFEAARAESSLRSLQSVEKVIITSTSGSSVSLVIKWFKQNKMNMLITSIGVLITATILFFPKQKEVEENVMQYVAPVADSTEEVIVRDQEATGQLELSSKTPDLPKQVVLEPEADDEPEVAEPKAPIDSGSSDRFKSHPTSVDQPTEVVLQPSTQAPVEEVKEYLIVLESEGGKDAAAAFTDYLKVNLPQLRYEFASTASKREIKKFTLKLDNRYEANFRMKVEGFDKLELYWEANSNGEIANMWYRLDSKEKKTLDFSESQKFSIRVKHIHEEF